ncbi:MAG: type II toxin-antitoxin system RelE/ParE family toxin [Rhodospirillaceae bacterium]
MEISFASRKLERDLSSHSAMQKAYGDRTQRLMRRLDLLRAAPCLADVPKEPPSRCHELTGSWSDHFAVDVTHTWRLVFRPAREPVPRTSDGGIDLNQVTAVQIVAVEDYH